MLHRKLLRELLQLRGQVAAISLVMIGGVAMLVMAMSNHHALMQTRDLYYAEHRFADVFAQVRRAPWPLIEAIRDIPGVREAEARIVGGARLELEGYDGAVTAQLVSLPDDSTRLNRLYLQRGRLPDPLQPGEAVVGTQFAEAHGLQPGDRIGAIIDGRRQMLTITGIGLSPEFVYQIRPGDLFPDFERFGMLWMPREALAHAFDLDGAFNDVVLRLEHGARSHDVIDRLDLLLAPYGAIGAYDRELQMSHRFLAEELEQLATMTRMFTLIFLAVGAFLLNVVIGRLIATQREQIAVLKAFGYDRVEVAIHYCQLALAMTAVGLLPGIAVGAWMGRGLANVYMQFYSFPFLDWSLPADVVALAFAFAAFTALIGAAGGLLRAYRLQPAEAMRPEAPPVFRHSLLERLGLFGDARRRGLPRLLAGAFDPTARMILRTLERRPWRTAMSVLGIGMAGGIMVMSQFQRGAIEHMVDVQFALAQRDDLSLALVEPASARAAQELAALPGVRAVEPFRAAPAILRHGHREYRTALQGLPADGDLRRVLDAELQPVALPTHGVMLTDHLADMLGLQPGQWFEVEFLDGSRRRVEVPLVDVVREYLGVGAYADRHYVNRLLDEDGVISGAWLGLDAGAHADVIERLRDWPRIAAVTDRGATIDSFHDTIAESILTFALVATALAASIAIGVVYNAARIALAERGRELASLRVLGYTRAEVRALLAGELYALSLLALLPGAAIGWAMAALLTHAFRSDLYRIPLVLQPSGFGLAGLVVLAATALSVMLVRRRLDRLDLVAVLKTRE